MIQSTTTEATIKSKFESKVMVPSQLVGYRVYEEVQALFREANKPKAGGAAAAAAAASKADLFKQMMRPRCAGRGGVKD